MKRILFKSFIALLIGVVLEICVFNFNATVSMLNNGYANFDINLFRIVIVPLIYMLGSFLFLLQKMPDYQTLMKEKGKDRGER